MGKITVTDYKPEHLELLKGLSGKRHEGEFPAEVKTRAFTLMIEDRPLAVIGFLFPQTHIAELWAFVSEEVKTVPIGFTKTCVKIIRYYVEQFQPKRMQCYVRHDRIDAHHWAQYLGFEKEGIVRHYGVDGTDYYLYGKVI